MVKRCSYGLCKSDTRYPERLENDVKFVPFPKPKTNYEKCLRWIKLCGRPHKQLNTDKINSNRYICTKHFFKQSWPTKEYPDPVPADPYTPEPKAARSSPKRRRLIMSPAQILNVQEQNITVADKENLSISSDATSQSTQTHNNWVEPLDLMALSAENHHLNQKLAKASLELIETKRQVSIISKPKQQEVTKAAFTLDDIISDGKLMNYYTGFSNETFLTIFKFLVPNEPECPINYIMRGNVKQVKRVSLKDQLLMTMCKLRLNLDLIDLGHRFNITKQTTSIIFNSWINYMFLRFGEIPTWPHRDIIAENMPEDYRKEFPNTFAILDCTEIKIEKPSSLKAQTQTYSDYKSSNTLKGLVAVDPRGSVMFVSVLYSGSVSDKEIFKNSGFKEQLLQLIQMGYLIEGDGLMGDKGFNIDEAVSEVGLSLNIPPFASSSAQMSAGDVVITKKIAKHRVHVERAIRRIKTFKILSQRLPVSLLSSVDQIWFVCAFLTNFMPFCIKKA